MGRPKKVVTNSIKFDRSILKQNDYVINVSSDETFNTIALTMLNQFAQADQNCVMKKGNYQVGDIKLDTFPQFIERLFKSYNFIGERWCVVNRPTSVMFFTYGGDDQTIYVDYMGTYAGVHEDIEFMSTKLKKTVKERSIHWTFAGAGGGLKSHNVPLYYQQVYDSFYPQLKIPLNEFVKNYKDSDASILILIGPPGTGKTNFIKHILYEGNFQGYVSYDPRVFGSDEFFANLLQFDSPTCVVFEDADNFLSARSDGNGLMHTFLNVSNGLIAAKNKKMIFSTNLPSLTQVDEALIRPGRCFEVLHFDSLTRDQAVRAYQDIAPGQEFLMDGNNFTLANLFNGKVGTVKGKMGF